MGRHCYTKRNKYTHRESLTLKYFLIAWLHIPCCAVLCLAAQLCLTLCDPMDCSTSGSSVHWDSQGKNASMDCHALLQGIFQTQGVNPALLHCRWILYHLSHQGSLCVHIYIFVCVYIYISEKVMAPHSSTLAWEIPWTEEPGRLQSMGSLRVGHDWATSL